MQFFGYEPSSRKVRSFSAGTACECSSVGVASTDTNTFCVCVNVAVRVCAYLMCYQYRLGRVPSAKGEKLGVFGSASAAEMV